MINEHCSYIHIKCSCSLILIDYELCCKQVFSIELSVFSMALDDAFSMSNTNDFSLFYVFDTSPLKYHVVLLEMKKHLDFSSIISLRQMNLKT